MIWTGGVRLTIDVRQAGFLKPEDKFKDRAVRISERFVRKMRERVWATTGDWELIDRNHRLRDERRWVKRLHAEWQASVTFDFMEPYGGSDFWVEI